MVTKLVLQLLGGFGLFMFGMKTFSEGLQNTAESRLKDMLLKLTKNRFLGVGFGFLVTAIVQSSSAVTVMTVSFVNAGLMNLTQAINVILGANIGTTVTGWIISLNINVLALPAIGIGSILIVFLSSNKKALNIGMVIMGFGLLFYGLIVMRDAFSSVKSSESFKQFFLIANANSLGGRLVCILIGAGVTAIVQSSSATLAVTISLASTGLIDYPTAVAFILGENIGTTITANLATLGASINARRASLVHFMFNFIGVSYMYLLFPFYIKFVNTVVIGDPYEVVNGFYPYVSYHIAAAHTIFNIFNVLVFFFFTKHLSNLACMIYKDKEKEKHVSILSDKLLNMPVSAELDARKEVMYMGEIASKMITRIKYIFTDQSDRNLNKIKDKEKTLDLLNGQIHSFLLKLLGRINSESAKRDITNLIAVSTYYENLGDNLKDLAIAISTSYSKKAQFSETQKNDTINILNKIDEYISYINTILSPSNTINKEKVYNDAKEKYNEIKTLYYEVREKHYKEVESVDMPPINAHLYGDALVYFNRSITNLRNIIEDLISKEIPKR